MDPQGPIYLLFVAIGFVLALSMAFFDKTQFAKSHRVLNTMGSLALIAMTCYASVRLTHNFSAWLLPMFGFFAVAKLKESSDKRRNFKALCAELTNQVELALKARDGGEAVEIDVSGSPESARWLLINTYKKQGLTVETLKNESTGTIKLRLSGQRAAPKNS